MRGLSADRRQNILLKWCTEPGLSLRKLAKMEVVSEKTVQTANRKFGEDHTYEDTLESDRKKVLITLV